MGEREPLFSWKNWRVYQRLLGFLKPYRRLFSLALLSMVVYGATDGAVPYILKRVLDDIFGKQNESMLNVLVAVIVVFAVIRGAFAFIQRYCISLVGLRIVRDMRNEIQRKLLQLSPSFFERNDSSSLITRMTNDTLLVRAALTDAVASILRDSIRVIALLIAAVLLDPVLAVISFIGFPLALLPVIRFGRKVRKLSRVGQEQFGGLIGVLQETIMGHKIVQVFGREQTEQERFTRENEELTRTFERAEKYGALTGPTNEIVASAATAAVILYGGYSVISGVRTQGDFIAFLTTVFLLYEPLKKLGRVNTIVQAGVAGAERIFQVMDEVPEIQDRPDAIILSDSSKTIEFESVSFRYGNGAAMQTISNAHVTEVGGEREWAIHDISLRIQPGQTIALVGPSGGGKTTLAHLLPRFFDPESGCVKIAGRDIREYQLRSLRENVGLVSQHTFLFNDTVFENIAYGKRGASREEVIAAAKAAHADVFIQQLPRGYDTAIGEQGLRLSGGQRARIAIARALLKDAPILILDEATASLDSESEAVVQQAIDRLMEGRTVLVIAHRFATIRRANAIAVIVGGRLVELGAHDELLGMGGAYSRLYQLQFQQDDSEMLGQVANLPMRS